MNRLVLCLALVIPALAHAHGTGGGGGHGGGGGGHGGGGGGGGHGGGGGGHGGGGGGHGGGGHGSGGHGSSGGSGWHPSSGVSLGVSAGGGGGSSDADGGGPCDPAVDVAALGGCRAFGGWALQPGTPHFFIEMGTLFRRFPSTLDAHTGSVLRGGERFRYRMRLSGARTTDSSVDFVLRLGGEVRPGVYVAVEGEIGGVVAFAPVDVMIDGGASGGPVFSQRHGFVDGAAAIVGVRERLGRAVLSVEVAGGVRDVVHPFRVRYDGVTGPQDMGSVVPVVEPRVRVEGWLSPYVSGGVTAGANTLVLGDWSAGVFVGLHTRAFDGW